MIREVGPDDWRDWRHVRQRSLTESPEAFASTAVLWTGPNDTEVRWRDRLASDGACFISYEADTPIGMVATKPEDSGVQLISMWVAPEARGRGIGAALIRCVIEWTGEQPLWLRIMDGNVPAQRAYESSGFELDESEPDGEGCRRMYFRP